MRVPFVLEGEYRGMAPSSTFIGREDQKEHVREAVLKLEVVMPDGDIEILELRRDQVDDAADFDCDKLERGQMLTVMGVVFDTQYGVRVRPSSVTRKGAVKAAA